jgi:hypothetical protein
LVNSSDLGEKFITLIVTINRRVGLPLREAPLWGSRGERAGAALTARQGGEEIAPLDSRTKSCYSVRQEVAMQETKLTVRLSRELLENAKRYARRQNTTVTNLISEYLRRMPASMDILQDAPIVRRLSGTLSKNVSVADYQKHLEAKYGGKN